MTDFRALLASMRRPRLLIRAARLGVADYQRPRDLRRVIDATTAADHALHSLLEAERQMEDTRQAGEASYSVARHIEVLIALIAEVRMLPPTEAT